MFKVLISCSILRVLATANVINELTIQSPVQHCIASSQQFGESPHIAGRAEITFQINVRISRFVKALAVTQKGKIQESRGVIICQFSPIKRRLRKNKSLKLLHVSASENFRVDR